MEKVAATIMKKLEPLLGQWIKDGGSFDSLTDLYLRRWMHSYVFPRPRLPEKLYSLVVSNEIVEVTTVTPPQRVKIVGITPDYGLLRTLPIGQNEIGSYGGRGYGGHGGFHQSSPFIDLQPDGNSFDIMAGLIKSKST
jgi:biotin--protein ligase